MGIHYTLYVYMYMYTCTCILVSIVYFALKLEVFSLVTVRYVESFGNAETLKERPIIIVYHLTPLNTQDY